jgi:Protein of unknown function (DUF2778)
VFAGQQPDRTWPMALQPSEGSNPPAREPVIATASGASHRTALPSTLLISLGLVALVLVGFLGTLMMRLGTPLKTVADLPVIGSTPKAAKVLPSLVTAPPPLADDASNPTSQTIEPEPPPIQFGVSPQASLEDAPPPATMIVPTPRPLSTRERATANDAAPLPPPRPLEFAPAPVVKPATGYDKFTAVYDISAHTVYLPDGTRLEAHSGLAEDRDDPRHVDERDRGATPPHLYELTLRESLFHGVQALRLNPIGEGFSFDRVGLLAHPYMLGPSGDSNGCVSFKNYDAFLRAFQSGEVKRLAVVARLTQEPREYVSLESPRRDLNR